MPPIPARCSENEIERDRLAWPASARDAMFCATVRRLTICGRTHDSNAGGAVVFPWRRLIALASVVAVPNVAPQALVDHKALPPPPVLGYCNII